VSGVNVIGRWSHTLSENSGLKLQFYYDRTHRDIPGTFHENLDTYDFDFQHHLLLGERHDVVWGLGYRRIEDHVGNSSNLAFLPAAGPNFVSEELVAYELGYRIQPLERLFFSLATFYNNYDKLRSIERINPAAAFPIVLANGLKGESYGAELTADYPFTDRWR